MVLFQNNVRILGGSIKGRTGNPLCIGGESVEERVEELNTSKLSVVGDMECSASTASFSVIDDTCYIDADHVFINGRKTIEFQNDVVIDGILTVVGGSKGVDNTNTAAVDIEIDQDTTVVLEGEEGVVFFTASSEDVDAVVMIKINNDIKNKINQRTFVAKRGFKGKIKFIFEDGDILINQSIVQIGFSEAGQCVDLMYYDGTWYLKHSGCEVDYLA